MSSLPRKFARLLIKWSVSSNKDDAVVAFDELYDEVALTSSKPYIWWWCFQHAARSLPWNLIGKIVNAGAILYKIGVAIHRIVS